MLAFSEVEDFPTPIKIGVVADTHLRSATSVPERVVRELRGVDLILHAGDITTLEVLRLFEAIAPVRAVVGNNDSAELQQILPHAGAFRFGRFTAGMIHGDGSDRLTARQAAERVLAGRFDLGVFGHSHQAYSELCQGTLLFNPGSATNRRWQPYHSLGIIRIGAEIDAELRILGP